jgi:hypothetical protein
LLFAAATAAAFFAAHINKSYELKYIYFISHQFSGISLKLVSSAEAADC